MCSTIPSCWAATPGSISSRCARTTRSSAGSPSAPTWCCSTRRAPSTPRRAFARFLEERRQGGRDVCFVVGGPYGTALDAPRPPAVARPDDAAAPARARGPARAALPRPQDPRGRAVPSLTCPSDPWKSCAPRSRTRPPSCATASPARASARRSSGRRRPASATTPPTPRCCSRPRSARRRGRSRSGWPGRCRARSGERVDHVEVAGPGLPQRLPRRGLVRRRARGAAGRRRGVRRRRARAARAGADRVRLRQPDGAADRRQRAPRRLRRRAGADPRAGRPRRQPRVLLQRLGLPGRPPRPVDPRPREGRGPAGGRLPGRLRRRARARHRGRRRARGRASSRAAASTRS